MITTREPPRAAAAGDPPIGLDPVPAGPGWVARGFASQFFLVPAFFLVVMIGWETTVNLLRIEAFVLPTPSAIGLELIEMVQSIYFWRDAQTTAIEMSVGYLASVGIAMALGLAVVQIRIVEKVLMPYIVALQAVPKTALAPVFLIWFGFGLSSKIVAAALSAFFPMLINVIVGLKAADRDQVAMLRSFDASNWQTFRYVELPGAMPFIFAGLKIAVVAALIGAVVGEFVGAQSGLGYRILQMNFKFNIAGVFATMVALSAMGLIPYYLLQFIQRRYVYWGDSSQVTVA